MQTEDTTPEFVEACVASGWAVKVRVQLGHLVVEDLNGDQRRVRRYSRATIPFNRLVILAHTGYVSFDAIRWCRDVGVALYQIDRDGALLAASAGSLGLDRANLRRAQALAASSPVGLEITRWLLAIKMERQASVCERLPSPAGLAPDLWLVAAEAPADLRPIEAEVAGAYWKAWQEVEVRFARNELPRIPEHWRTFGHRLSPISGGARSAGNPANAILNFTYTVLEAEARNACLGVGLDPGLGVLHVDTRSRDSLALDVMEPVRPVVDAYVLDLLTRSVFRASDFLETRRGICRVNPPISHLLSATGPMWARHLAPIVEEVCRMLLPGERLSTPLTRANRNTAQDGKRVRPRVRRKGKGVRRPPRPIGRCRNCGDPLENSARVVCDNCLPAHRAEQLASLPNHRKAAAALPRPDA